MLEDMFYLFLSKIVRTEPVYNGRPKRNRLYSLCLSLCVCVCVFGARGRGEVHALKLSRERAASTGQTQTTEGWLEQAIRSPKRTGDGVSRGLTMEGSGGRQVSRIFFSKNSARE